LSSRLAGLVPTKKTSALSRLPLQMKFAWPWG
jgi:hypothetical protein